MQIFPKSLNHLPTVVAVLSVLALPPVVVGVWYYFSPKNLQVGYKPTQPVPYSHQLHAGQLGMDCRYCHSGVETSHTARVPPNQTCMGCHAIVHPDSPALEPLREAWVSGGSIEWVKVHKVPDHAYFNHSAHVSAGVGCASCHGRVDQMEVVEVVKPLSMGWCLECHRNPEENLRPPSRVTDMDWGVDGNRPDEDQIVATSEIHPPQHCSACHQ